MLRSFSLPRLSSSTLGTWAKSFILSAPQFSHLHNASRPNFTGYFLRVVRKELSHFFLEGLKTPLFGGKVHTILFVSHVNMVLSVRESIALFFLPEGTQ